MMFSFQMGSSPQPVPRPKPRLPKTSIACNSCKTRKTKCDGVRPVCGPCLKRGHNLKTCLYRKPDQPLRLTTAPDTTRENAVSVKDTEAPRERSEPPHSNDQTDDIDSTSQFSSTIPSGSFFGASSGADILNEVRNVKDVQDGLSGKRRRTSGDMSEPLRELPKLHKRIASKRASEIQFVIPTRKVADQLLNLYWDYVDNAYPWLDRLSIKSAYETLWVEDGELSMNEQAFHCILNLMFATSCVASMGQAHFSQDQSAVSFFNRAEELMDCGLMDIYNLEIIQILLLMAVYLQHEKVPQKCFRNISTAIHIAQELGLHLPSTIEAKGNSRDRDLARQVWNGCVIMDRIASMTFGCELKIPQRIANQALDSLCSIESPRNENPALPSQTEFYISFSRLHLIIGDVLESFISHDNRVGSAGGSCKLDSSAERLAKLFKIESELQKWTGSLHPFFQMPVDREDPTPTKHITRQANILRAKYLSVRLLLFRPFLLQIQLKKPENASIKSLYSDDQIMRHVVVQCQINCTKAAGDIIEFIFYNSPEKTHAYILPSNWYTVSYVYVAVTVLLAAQMCPDIIDFFSIDRLKELLQQALKIMKKYEHHSIFASRCRSVIKMIEENIGKNPNSEEVSHDAGHDEATLDSLEQLPSNTDSITWAESYEFDWNDWSMFLSHDT